MSTAGAIRTVTVVSVLSVLGARVFAIQGPVDWIMYGASWVTILHLCVGAFLFVRLGADSSAHRALEFTGLLCVVVLAWWFTEPVWWCTALAILMVVAIVKYILLYRIDNRPVVRTYAREKIMAESPAILVMTGIAICFHRSPIDGSLALYLSLFVLAGTAVFTIWLVVVRKIYHKLLDKI